MKKGPTRRLSEGFSLARYIIELLAYHWAMERELLGLSALKFYTEDENQLPSIPEERKRGVLQYVSNILNALSRKELIYLVKRKYVINVPRILYLYHINLPRDREPSQEDKRRALVMASGGIVQHLGEATFSREEALGLAEEVVKKHYEAKGSSYLGFLQALESFIENATRFYARLNEPETSKFFEDEAMRLLDRYLFRLLLMRETEEPVVEFVEELWTLLTRVIGDEELISKTLSSWRELSYEAELLTYDKDFRTKSYARKFVYKVINVELSSALLGYLI